MKRKLLLLIVSVLFYGSMYADHFVPDETTGLTSFGIWGQVFIDGEAQTSNSIEVGLFIGDVCKATARITPNNAGTRYRVLLYATYGTDEDSQIGLPITFKLYNHETEEEIDNCGTSYTTDGNDQILGTGSDLKPLTFTHMYEIQASANPEGYGVVTGAGNYAHASEATLTATPNDGYTFINWTENDVEVSTDASYTFTVTAARNLVANFEEIPYGPAYPWTVNVNQGPNVGSLSAVVQINGTTITDGTNWEVGAFDSNNVCHGVVNIDNNTWVTTVGYGLDYDCYMMMSLYGNENVDLTFYLYDREAGAVVEAVCDFTLSYVPGEDYGDFWDDEVTGDGEPIIIINFVTTDTFTLDITGYGESEGHYYLIASPIGEVNPSQVGDMFKYEHDLYYFDQDHELEWVNIRDGNTNLIPGKGYLYASKQDVTLTFYGSAYDRSGEVVLVKDASNNPDGGFEGWNLVGNPFAQMATVDRPFYTMNEDGDEIISVTGNTVQAMEGIFVVAEEDGEIMNFSIEPSKAQAQIIINVTRDRGHAIDRAIVRFDQASTLPKFMLNKNNTKVYITMDGEEFAMVRSNKVDKVPVNFEPAENGVYSISVNTENVYARYLHLIDNQTGADIDLLQTPNYRFEAKTTDDANRFDLVFETSSKQFKEFASRGDAEEFSFCNDGNWIINNEGDAILQVVDINGQILSSEEISGCFSKHIEAAPGVYMLRLINGNEMKVQKIVIK